MAGCGGEIGDAQCVYGDSKWCAALLESRRSGVTSLQRRQHTDRLSGTKLGCLTVTSHSYATRKIMAAL